MALTKNGRSITKLIKGFTLVEVLVTLGIVTVIMSTVLFNYRTFNDSLALSSAAQEMAIVIRQAQTYGLTVKEVSIGGGQFSSAYGVYFDKRTSPQTYVLFADIDADRTYDAGSGCGSGSTECVELFTFRNGVIITEVTNESGGLPEPSVEMLQVTFLRPNPDAAIYFTNNSNQIKAGPSFTGKVKLVSRGGKFATITIESTGQVLAQ